MTVGFYSPLPPARTGVADYSAALLEALGRFGRVEANPRRAEVALYHLGNNQLHRDIYRRALREPGVVVLHDAVLHHFFLGSLDRDSYVEEFVYNYGEWSRELAAGLWAGRARSAQDARYFRYPMLRRVAEAARAVVVHNPAAARMVSAHCPGAPVVEIPHLFCPPAMLAAAEVIRWRRSRGLDSGTFLFGVFGYLRESKRLPVILRAWRKVKRAGLRVALLVAGEFSSPDLARAVTPLTDGVLRAGHLPEREFWKLAAATDACLSLRYPAAGETSGIAVRFMGIGKPVLVTAGEETAPFPETACLRVDPGPAEGAMLAEYMTWLARFPEAAREIGRRAAAFIGEEHALEAVAARYWGVLCQCR